MWVFLEYPLVYVSLRLDIKNLLNVLTLWFVCFKRDSKFGEYLASHDIVCFVLHYHYFALFCVFFSWFLLYSPTVLLAIMWIKPDFFRRWKRFGFCSYDYVIFSYDVFFLLVVSIVIVCVNSRLLYRLV